MATLERRSSLATMTLVFFASSAIHFESAFAFQSPAFDQDTLQALEIENRVVEARRRITSCEVVVEHRNVSGRRATYRLICDGPNVRMGQDGPVVAKTDDHIITRDSRAKPHIAGQIHPRDWNGTMIFDPRQLGFVMVPVGVLHSCNELTDCLAHRDRVRSTLTREQNDACDLVHIRTTYHDESTSDLWIDEERGPSLVKAEYHCLIKGRPLHDRLTVDLVEVDGAWFPSKVVHQRATTGLFWSADVAELREIRINQGVDYELFTPVGMGFQPGDRIDDFRRSATRSTTLIWNGKEFVWPPGEERR